MTLGVLGAGWVGLVTAACFAELGHDVVVRDVLPEKIDRLRAGDIPIYEPGLDKVVEKNVAAGRLHFTTDITDAVKGALVVFLAEVLELVAGVNIGALGQVADDSSQQRRQFGRGRTDRR